MKTDSKEPINPTTYQNHGYDSKGLAKREYFAAMAMQNMAIKSHGEYNQSDFKSGHHLNHPRWVARAAVEYADALIKALNEAKDV